MIYLYRKKENLIYELHTLTLAVFILSIFFLALLFTHPLYLTSLMFITSLLLITSGNLKEWKGYLKFSLPLVGIIIIVNTLFVRVGSTVLYSGPRVPVIGRIRITLEALIYGGAMGLRLLIIISIFCLFTYTVQPDRFMKLFGKFSSKLIFIIILSIRLFPLMVEDFERITEVQKTRGVSIENDSFINKVKKTLPMVSVLLLSSLERSFEQAESMYSRGYATGRRIIYKKDIKRTRDKIIFSATGVGLAAGITSYIWGYTTYTYYPELANLNLPDYNLYFIFLITLMVPSLLNWGCKKWPKLKSKI